MGGGVDMRESVSMLELIIFFFVKNEIRNPECLGSKPHLLCPILPFFGGDEDG